MSKKRRSRRTFGARVSLAPPTSERLYRLNARVSIEELAREPGIRLSAFRISVFERDSSLAKPGELDRHRRGVDAIVARREAERPALLRDAISALDTLVDEKDGAV